MRLVENASQSTYRNFARLGNNGYVHDVIQAADKLNVTALLAGFHKSGRFQAALDFAKWQRAKPPQSRPRQCEFWEDAWLAEVRSIAQALRAGWPRLPLRCHPGWPRPLPDTARRSS